MQITGDWHAKVAIFSARAGF